MHDHGPQEQNDQTYDEQRQHQIKIAGTFLSNEVVGSEDAPVILILEKLHHVTPEAVGISQGGGYGGGVSVGGVKLHLQMVALYQKALDLLSLEQVEHIRIGDSIAAIGKQIGYPGERHEQDHQVDEQRQGSTLFQW